MGEYALGPFWSIPGTYPGFQKWLFSWINGYFWVKIQGGGVVQNMSIFGSKYSYYCRVVPGRLVPPANCLMCHITSHYMAKHVSGPFVPSQCTLIALEGGLNKHAPKSSCYLRVVPVRWVPSWNCLMSHITPHCMATEWIADLVLKEYSYICYSIWNQAKICESTINVQNTHNLLIK